MEDYGAQKHFKEWKFERFMRRHYIVMTILALAIWPFKSRKEISLMAAISLPTLTSIYA